MGAPRKRADAADAADGRNAAVDGWTWRLTGYRASPTPAYPMCLSFNGAEDSVTDNSDTVKDRIVLGGSPDLKPTGDFTIALSYYPFGNLAGQTIASDWLWGTGYQGRWALAFGTGGSTNRVVFSISNSAGADTVAATLTSSFTTSIAWNHLVITKQGTTLRMYRNGSLDGSATLAGSVPATIPVTNAPIELGRWPGTPRATATTLFGRIRGPFRVYRRALTAAEITALAAGNAVAGYGLCCDYPLAGSLIDTLAGAPGQSFPVSPGGPAWVTQDPSSETPGTRSIMALGDSNTLGTGYTGAWRGELRNQLEHVWGKRFQFVGQLSDAVSAHEGVSGNTLVQMQARLSAALAANPRPTVLVILGGQNDIVGGSTAAQTRDHMRSLIDAAMADPNPPLWIVVSRELPMIPTYAAAQQAFNGMLPQLIADMKAGIGGTVHTNVLLSDGPSGLNNPCDFQHDAGGANGHLNRSGHERTAVQLAATIAPLL